MLLGTTRSVPDRIKPNRAASPKDRTAQAEPHRPDDKMNLLIRMQDRLPKFVVERVTLNNLVRYEPIFYSNDDYYMITDGHSATKQDCIETIAYMDGFPPDRCYSVGFSKNGQAMAFLSLFEGDPEPETVYVGLFLVHAPSKSNNRSGCSFWKKLGFQVVGETPCDRFINYSMALKKDI